MAITILSGESTPILETPGGRYYRCTFQQLSPRFVKTLTSRLCLGLCRNVLALAFMHHMALCYLRRQS